MAYTLADFVVNFSLGVLPKLEGANCSDAMTRYLPRPNEGDDLVGDTSGECFIFHLLHRASQCADETFKHAARDIGLTPRQYIVLLAIAEQPGASQTGLVESTGVDRSTLGDLVRRLEQRQLLARRRHETDARTNALEITPDGSAAVQSAQSAVRDVEQAVIRALGTEGRERLARSLLQVVAVLQNDRSSAVTYGQPEEY